MDKIEFKEANELVSALQNDVSETIFELRSEEKEGKIVRNGAIKEVIFAGNEMSFYGGYGNKLTYDSLRNAKRRGLRRLAGIIEDKMEDYSYWGVKNMLIGK